MKDNIISILIIFTILALAFIVICNPKKEQPKLPVEPEYSYELVYDVVVSAYSSTENQTDSTPTITATLETCYYGGCAVSKKMEKIAPMGSKIIFDSREYYVNDRMNEKWEGWMVDIWMETKEDATIYGRQRKPVVVVEVRKNGENNNKKHN